MSSASVKCPAMKKEISLIGGHGRWNGSLVDGEWRTLKTAVNVENSGAAGITSRVLLFRSQGLFSLHQGNILLKIQDIFYRIPGIGFLCFKPNYIFL